VAARYFTAWQGRDEATLRDILAADVTFAGPLGRAAGREDCIAGLMGMLAIVTDIDVTPTGATSRTVASPGSGSPSIPAPSWPDREHRAGPHRGPGARRVSRRVVV